MKIICVAASNTIQKGNESTSVKVGKLIGDMIKSKVSASKADIEVEAECLPLMNYELKYCMLCGKCAEKSACPFDPDFNRAYTRIASADALFWIVPHYSPLPARLMTLFEKMNEIFYASWMRNPQFKAPLHNKACGVIGHGGMTESPECLKYYHQAIIAPVANTLKSFGLNVIGLNEEFPLGVPFGLKSDDCIKANKDSVFPDIKQDWELIKSRIEPLVYKVVKL